MIDSNDALTLEFDKFFRHEITKCLPVHAISEAYLYALFPAGKYFRPKLALNAYMDLKTAPLSPLEKENLFYFAMALECHHAYSLVHDDLPSMDNDDFRRGKPSTHKKFGEWRAILVGDGLLNISYQLLLKIKLKNHETLIDLLKLFSWAMGPKGLILGQVMDLSNEMTLSFDETLLTHKYKTARLIQVALLGSFILSSDYHEKKIKLKTLWKATLNLGVLFQLLDDLSELTDTSIEGHEEVVNPWIHFHKEAFEKTISALKDHMIYFKELKLPKTELILKKYFIKMNESFMRGTLNLDFHLPKIDRQDLDPMMGLINQICSLNNIK